MARPTVRGLLGMVAASLLVCFAPAPVAGQSSRVPSASASVSLATVARQLGLKVTVREQGAALTLTGTGVQLEFTAGSREAAWNGYRLFLGEPPVLQGRNLTLTSTDWRAMIRPLIDPGAVKPPGRLELVVIDPGHGGSDPGTENRRLKLQEKTYTLDVAKRLKRDLEKRGYRVLLTRTADVRLKPGQSEDLAARVAKANRAGADLFISLHFNSLPDNGTVRGIETYALTPAGQRSTAVHERRTSDRTPYPGNRHDHWNMVLSSKLQHQLVKQLAAVDRGLKHARFAVLRPVQCPAALVEGGFLSNSTEAQKIKSAAYRQKMAEAIGDGIGDYAVQLRAAAAPKRSS